jgi:hypothetical protein
VVDAATGTERRRASGGFVEGVASGVILTFDPPSDSLVGHAVVDGAELWRARAGSVLDDSNRVVAVDGSLLVSVREPGPGSALLDLETGGLTPIGFGTDSKVADVGADVVYGMFNESVRGLDLGTGTPLWDTATLPPGAVAYNTSAELAGDVLVVAVSNESGG